MRSHEKRVNVCPRTQGKYLVSVVLTAVFAIASLFGTLLFSADAVADAAESQAVAQVGNATYASVQEAIGRTTLKNTTVTLLADVTESVTITPPKGVRNVTFDLNGHTLQATESGGAAGFATITVPANMQLTIVGPGTVAGGTQPAVDCRGALRVESGMFTSDATLMRFAETNETSAQGSFSGGTFTAPMLFNLLDDAKNLGYVTVRGGEYRGMIPAGLNTLALLSGSFSDLSNLAPYLADSLGLIPGGTSGDGMGDGMFHVGDLAISSKQASVELDPVDGLQRLSADDLLKLTETQLNGIADYLLVVDSDQLQALNDQIDSAIQAVGKRKAFEAVSQNITITAVRNTSDDDFTDANAARSSGMPNGASSRGSANASGGAGMQLRTSDHDGISAQVTVTIKAVAEPEEPEEPGKPSNPEKPEKPEMPRSGSAVQALAIISLLLVIASAICAYATVHLQSSASAQLVFSALFLSCADGKSDLCRRKTASNADVKPHFRSSNPNFFKSNGRKCGFSFRFYGIRISLRWRLRIRWPSRLRMRFSLHPSYRFPVRIPAEPIQDHSSTARTESWYTSTERCPCQP